MDYLKPNMSEAEINKISVLGLAHIGDAVYELMTRSALGAEGHTAVQELHRLAIGRVNAAAQARAAERLQPLLDEEESAVFRRGRNAHVNSVPHGANGGEYHAATGLEALFGWLFLQGRTERLNELFESISSADEEKEKEKCRSTP